MPDQKIWMTRDSDSEGQLDVCVDIWLERPSLHEFAHGSGWMWMDSSTTGVEQRHARWTIDQAMREMRVVPDHVRQCIVRE